MPQGPLAQGPLAHGAWCMARGAWRVVHGMAYGEPGHRRPGGREEQREGGEAVRHVLWVGCCARAVGD